MPTESLDTKLIAESPLLVLPSLATAVGLNEAIVLQQLHFRARLEGDGWWRANMAELRTEFSFWSEPTIKRTVTGLRKAGLVEARQFGTDRANHYRIDYDALKKRVKLRGGQNDPVHRITLSTKRSDASDQNDPISLNAVKRKAKAREREGAAAKFSRFDKAIRR